MPARTASSTTYWIAGLSTIGSISLGWALVAGRNRVPSPAAGITALVTDDDMRDHSTTSLVDRARPMRDRRGRRADRAVDGCSPGSGRYACSSPPVRPRPLRLP